MNEQSLELRKPNVTLVMVPKVGKLTTVERKLLNSMLLSSLRQINEYRDAHGSLPSNTSMYVAKADELLDPVEVGKSNLKAALRKHLLALRRAEMDWESPDAKTGTVWKNLSLLSQVNFELRQGRLYVLWALPPEINKTLSEHRDFPFTKLDLAQIAKLQSYTSVALYEICARYRNNFLKGGDGECLTSSNPPDWWVEALSNSAPKIDPVTKMPVRREWRKVKNEAVNKAVEEINELTDLTIELLEKKDGKAISLVQFRVRKKTEPAREIPASDFEQIKIGLRLGLTEVDVASAIARTSVAQVSIALAKLEARLNQKDLTPVENLSRYFSAVVSDGDPVEVISDAQAYKKKLVVADASVESGRMTERSAHTAVREAFMVLQDSEKRVYASRALDEMLTKGIATKRVQQNAEAGIWSGPLLAKMIEIYRSDAAKS